MNILIAATHLKHSNGGVCTHIIDLCKEFSKMHNVVLVADGSDYDSVIAGIPNLSYYELPINSITLNFSSTIRCLRDIRRIVKKFHIEIIHLHSQRLIPFAWVIRQVTGVPFLWTNHIDAIPHEKLFVWMCKCFRFPIISVSSDLKDFLVKKLGLGENIYVVNNGIDTSNFNPLSIEEQCTIRKKYSIGNDYYIISEVARITHVKGQHILVQAVHHVIQRHPNMKIKILLAGTGDMAWLQNHVLDYANEKNLDCSYLGFCDPREIYGISDLAVLPSAFEGFSLSSVEALAMKCPVIRSNTPGYSDMKEYVLVHKIGDVIDLAEKIEYAVMHQEELRKKTHIGYIAAKHVFTKENTAKQTMAVYYHVLRGNTVEKNKYSSN